MRSNYRKLGPYIREVISKNTNLQVNTLLGVSITKKFIPSIANTIGTDMSRYKIVRKSQFAYGPVTSRNGNKISVALLQDEECIISTSYTVFEIIDKSLLLPEYLMMWFRRPEFDRYARYMSHGSVRELFSWEEMCDIELPVPSIEKQREIVREYKVITDRITINGQLSQKLEETAQTIYKHWFEDFEFPISAEYAASIGKPELKGKPYRSGGGELIYNAILDKEIPRDWKEQSIHQLIKYNDSNYKQKVDKFTTIEYLDTSSITNNRIDKIQHLIVGKDIIPSRARRKVEHNDIVYSTIRPNLKHFGLIKYPKNNMLVSTGFMVLQSTNHTVSNELILIWLTTNETIEYFQSKAEMSVSTYPSIKPEDILEVIVALPDSALLLKANSMLGRIFEQLYHYRSESAKLDEVREVLLQRIASLEK